MTDRTCPNCAKPIPPDRRANARYCSRRCTRSASHKRNRARENAYRKAWRHRRKAQKPPKPCATCGDPLPITINATATYCGRPCKRAAHRDTINAAQRARRARRRAAGLRVT